METISIPIDSRTGKPQVTNEMKVACIGEFSWKADHTYFDEDGHEVVTTQEITVPWDVCKEIYKAMAIEASKVYRLCPACNGRGYFSCRTDPQDTECSKCKGTGKV